MVELNATLPLSGTGCTGHIHITGDRETVERMMDAIRTFVQHKSVIDWHESRVPPEVKPGPCRGCGG